SIIYSWESIGKIKEFQTPSSKYLTESDIYTFETIIFKHFHDQFSNYGLGNTKSYNNLIKVRLKKFVNKIPDIRSEGYSAKSMKMILLRFSNIGTHIKRLENVAEKCINNPHHIATGSERHRSSIMERPTILKRVLCFMEHNNPDIRVVTVLCLINLMRMEDNQNCSIPRIQKLRQLGFDEKVKNMATDENLDVREKILL
ncbi:2672_t:CDS:2, partial [Entrophospora sp. SA101]